MLGFAAKALGRCLLLLFAVSLLVFFLVSVSPIDPVEANYGQASLLRLSPEKIAALREAWGVDQPFWERYAHWIAGVLTGDLGESLRYNAPVVTVIGQRLGNSLLLAAIAWVASGLLGFLLGVVAGVFRGRAIDRAVQAYCFILASTPTFWVALVLLLIFAVSLHWFPVGFASPIGVTTADATLGQALHHMALPAIALTLVGVSDVALHTREKVVDILESDYVRAAYASGETTSEIVFHHLIRNALLPAISIQFALVAEIFGGSVLVETVFSYPGLGQAAVTAGLGGDVELLAAIALISAAIVFAGNFIADLLYAAVDPRMRRRRTLRVPAFNEELGS